jgi:electron transport complex protein RnfD
MTPRSSPHAHAGSSVNRIMLDVCLALIPCTSVGFYLFGWPAAYLWLVTCAAAVATEIVCLQLRGRPVNTVLDGSALLTGWLIALTLPPWAPWWIGVGGSLFAIAIGKQLYGGVGMNLFNPAMLARVGLLIAFPLQMTTWIQPLPLAGLTYPDALEGLRITFEPATRIDGYTGATALGELKTALTLKQTAPDILAEHFVWWQSLFGLHAGSLGETSELLVLLGAAWLLWRRIISWEIPVALLLTLAMLATVASIVNPLQQAGPLFHLTSGGVLLGAFFIATDPVTSPISRTAKLLFGAGCAVVIFVVRVWGGFPEAVGFAVLFMNALTPLLDTAFKPRVYGRTHRGKPLPVTHAKVVVNHGRKS